MTATSSRPSPLSTYGALALAADHRVDPEADPGADGPDEAARAAGRPTDGLAHRGTDPRTPATAPDAPWDRVATLEPAFRPVVATMGDHDVRRQAAAFAQAMVEVVSGHRPAAQLVRWTSREVYADLSRRAELRRRVTGYALRTRPEVRSVHVSRPAPEAAEVSVHLRHGHRSRAAALRLERRRGRWVCVALELG